MKVQIEIVEKSKKGDILVFDGKKYVPINKDVLLRELKNDIESLKNDMKVIKGE